MFTGSAFLEVQGLVGSGAHVGQLVGSRGLPPLGQGKAQVQKGAVVVVSAPGACGKGHIRCALSRAAREQSNQNRQKQ